MRQRTLFLIKPNVTKKDLIGEVLQIVEKNGFVIEELKMFKMDELLADEFYKEHLEKSFYSELSEFMRSERIVGAVLSREEAVSKLRELVGDTDSNKAELGTIRSMYGDSKGENAVHASDSLKSAEREIKLIFG